MRISSRADLSLQSLLRTPAVNEYEVPAAALVWEVPLLAGRLVELSADGAAAPLSAACSLVRQVQEGGELAAWVSSKTSCFFPPDVMATGIDAAALPVVRCGDMATMVRATEMLVRSGAFALVITDVGSRGEISLAQQGRLVSLAQKHDTAILCLTEKSDEMASLGSMVSLRLSCQRVPAAAGASAAMAAGAAMAGAGTIMPGTAANDQALTCTLRVLKDKRQGPGRRVALTFAPILGM